MHLAFQGIWVHHPGACSCKITTIFALFTPLHPIITPKFIPFPPHPLRRDERGSSYEDAPHIAIASHAVYEMEGSSLTSVVRK